MTHDILIQIIDKKLIVEFLLILLIYFIEDLVVLKLGFQIIGLKIGLSKIWFWIILLIFFNFAGRSFLPQLVYFLIYVVFLALIFKSVGDKSISWIKAFWSAFMNYFIVSLVVVIFQLPLLLNKEIYSFMLKTPLGVAVGSLFEIAGPLAALYFFRTFKITIIPFSEKKTTKLDFWGLYLFGTIFCVMYSIFVIFMLVIETGSQLTLTIIVILAWVMTVSELVAYHVIRTLTQKEYDKHDTERRQYENELKTQQAKIDRLSSEKQDLMALNERLKANAIDPKEAAEAMLDIAERLQNSANEILEQQRIYLVSNDGGKPVEVHLTSREKTVLLLLGQAKTNQQIAETLKLKENYVKNIVSKLIEKFRAAGVYDRVGLALYASKNDFSETGKKVTGNTTLGQ